MNKKVLYISYNGLLEPILSSQAIPYLKILSKNGYRFILLTFEKTKDLKKIGRKGLKDIENSLEKEGIIWKRLRYHKYPGKFSTFLDITIGFFVSLYVMVKHKAGIIHVRGATPGVITLFLPKSVKSKVLFDTRGLLAEEYAGGGLWKEGGLLFNLVKAVEKMLLKRADAIVVLTEKHYKKLTCLPSLRERKPSISIIPCCVDIDRFKCNLDNHKDVLNKYNITEGPLFIYPGKLGTFYLVREMIDFFECASSVRHGLKFLILTQDDAGRLKNKGICAYDHGVHVIHPSFEEMPVFLNCADAGIFFINPYKKFGSSPIKLGEFLACGKPVIINSGIGDTEEFVNDNRVGIVVRNFNRNEYLNKFTELMELLKEGEALRARCRMTAEKYLSLNMGAKRYLNIYKELD